MEGKNLKEKEIYDAKKDSRYQNPYIDVDKMRERELCDGRKIPFWYVHGGFRDTITLHVQGMRTLRHAFPKIIDALDADGSGDMYEGLTEDEKKMLREVTLKMSNK